MELKTMILSMKTKDINKDLKNLEDIFDFSNLDENHELFSNKKKKVIIILFDLLIMIFIFKNKKIYTIYFR